MARINVNDYRASMYIKILQAEIKDVEVVSEYKFHPKRKWRFDFAFPSLKLAIEIDGAIWTGGRHVHPAGYLKDLEKFNTATTMGWRILRFSTDDQFSKRTLEIIESAVEYIKQEREK